MVCRDGDQKTDMKSECGVKLTSLRRHAAGDRADRRYRLPTLRTNQARLIPDRDGAKHAFDLEVLASLLDPVLQQIITPH
jgi:hypothetical protein